MHGLRIFIASAFGALMGYFASFEVLPWLGFSTSLWPLCTLLGGLVGHLAYDPLQLLHGIKSAWVETTNWQRNWRFVGTLALSCLFVELLVVQICAAGFGLLWLTGNPVSTKESYETVIMLSLSMTFFSLLASLLLVGDKNPQAKAWDVVRFVSPFHHDYAPYALLRVMPSIVLTIVVSVARFVKHVFVFIHSEARTTCFSGGLMGTAVGVMTGSWLIGAIAGGIIGLVSYELIGKRLLHVASK